MNIGNGNSNENQAWCMQVCATFDINLSRCRFPLDFFTCLSNDDMRLSRFKNLETISPKVCLPIQKDLILKPGQAEHFLRSRRSIRVYKKQPGPKDLFEKALSIACCPPTGSNKQPVKRNWGCLKIINGNLFPDLPRNAIACAKP